MSPADLASARHLRTANATTRSKRARSERGSATLHVISACVVLFTVLAVAVLWSAISTARHKLTAAADLTALSAATSLAATAEPLEAPAATPSRPTSPTPARSVPPCVTAARAAAANNVQLISCEVTSTAVTVEVSLQLELRLARPTLTATARAGPV